MPKKTYRIWRLDPAKRAIAPLALDGKQRDFALTLQRLCRANQLGHSFLVDFDGVRLCVASDARAEEGLPGFRFRGAKPVTAGIGVLFGQGENGGLVGAPIDRAWIDRHLVWTSPAETDAGERETDDA
jgi:hypothetical protein